MVHVGEAEEEDDDGGCWRGSPGIDRADVKRFGWRQLAITLMKRRCFQCGAQPSFVVFLDNTRKCQKCISTEKLRREVEETKRWELKHQQPQQSEDEDEDEGNEHEDDVEQQAKRMKTTLCTEESKQKRRAVKVSRRLTRCVLPTGQSQSAKYVAHVSLGQQAGRSAGRSRQACRCRNLVAGGAHARHRLAWVRHV
jgi:hypothetical protein